MKRIRKLLIASRFQKNAIACPGWHSKLALVFAAFLFFCSTSGAQVKNFSIYGYIDLEYKYDTTKKISTFDIHHFNILTNFDWQQFRVFSEIEWEHGPEFSKGSSQGKIVLERAWFEYFYNDQFRLRAGKFVTPFGIYNLLHDATPSILTTSLPMLYGKHSPFGLAKDRLYAKFYTGLQVLGLISKGSNFRLEYALGIGNGRGNQEFSSDNDNNKALILRSRLLPVEGLAFGASYYGNRSENGLSGKPRAREYVYAVDFEIENRIFLLQAEHAWFWLEKNGPGGAFQNARTFYAMLAYMNLSKFIPIIRYDRFDPDIVSAPNAQSTWLLGMNITPGHGVYLKAEVQFRAYEQNTIKSDRLFLSSLAVAF